MSILHPSGLTAGEIADLRALALQAAQNAYAPYSKFRVGAALLLENGERVLGCNVENCSYRLTTCAEQTAIVAAVARYGPAIRIRAVAVANLNAASSTPCGACRQTIREFASAATWIFYPGTQGDAETTIGDLLPSAFCPDDLGPAA